jgi:hypothetical protein
MKQLSYNPNHPCYVDPAIKRAERKLEELHLRRAIYALDVQLKHLNAYKSLHAPQRADE